MAPWPIYGPHPAPQTLSPISRTRRLHNTNSLKSQRCMVRAEHSNNLPAPAKLFMQEATQYALTHAADKVILKRQLAQAKAELATICNASKPLPRRDLDASTTGRFVYTDQEWAEAQEAKEAAMRAKKYRTSRKVTAEVLDLPGPSVLAPGKAPLGPPAAVWDEDVFGAFEGPIWGHGGDAGDLADGDSETDTD